MNQYHNVKGVLQNKATRPKNLENSTFCAYRGASPYAFYQ